MVYFVPSLGPGGGGDDRPRHGVTTRGPTLVVTDLCVMKPDPVTKELTVTALQPGVTREAVTAATGWPVKFAEPLEETPPPTEAELRVLRDLYARTAAAHGDKA
jgi:glutaconate CoA-transferase subunit B